MKLWIAMIAVPPSVGACLAEQGTEVDQRADTTVSGDVLDVDSGPSEAFETALEIDPDAPLPGESWTLSSDQPSEVRAQSNVSVALVVPEGATPASVVWSLEQPSGSVSLLMSSDPLHASVVANNVGPYRIIALVLDAYGQVIAHASHTFLVSAGQGLHVELSWHTPGDFDESDMNDPLSFFSVGTDVDLHLLSSVLNRSYFDALFDCFYANRNPEWATFGPANNPELNRDDTDGAGPEIITLSEPEVARVYTVGVHYYDDWGYGDSLATLRIFVDGVLRDEWADVNLRMDDMWESHTIVDGVVTRIGTEPSITPNYYYD